MAWVKKPWVQLILRWRKGLAVNGGSAAALPRLKRSDYLPGVVAVVVDVLLVPLSPPPMVANATPSKAPTAPTPIASELPLAVVEAWAPAASPALVAA
jgi:hypothetical protein